MRVTIKYGKQPAPLVFCAKHGEFHPQGEECRWCEWKLTTPSDLEDEYLYGIGAMCRVLCIPMGSLMAVKTWSSLDDRLRKLWRERQDMGD
jgi:hypothetical protein